MRNIVDKLVDELKNLNKDSYIVSIDGRCGSGKTSITEIIKEKLNANVVHIDHFYLPFNERKENWKEILAGNMNFERLYNEVIIPYGNHEVINVKGYNAHKDCCFDLDEIDPDRPLIIEGSYSSYFDDYDFKVFMTCSKEVQKKRLLLREGMNYENFERIWMTKEEEFFKHYESENKADMVIDTSENIL